MTKTQFSNVSLIENFSKAKAKPPTNANEYLGTNECNNEMARPVRHQESGIII